MSGNGGTTDEEELELEEVDETTERGVALPVTKSVPPPLPDAASSRDPREVIKNQERQLASLRRDLAMRSEAIRVRSHFHGCAVCTSRFAGTPSRQRSSLR